MCDLYVGTHILIIFKSVCFILGLESKVTLQKTQTAVFASLKNITVFNPAVDALYPEVQTFGVTC